MGDTLHYIDGECEEWADEVDYLILQGYSRKEAIEAAGGAPLPDCIEYISQEEQKEGEN